MQLVDEEQLTKFVTKIVLNLKPELKELHDGKSQILTNSGRDEG